ncbi:membrane associated rhomboid family serine protease [Roseivirga pacifica]|uniref:Membrane associated serine protease, rhomboid family n=1 Tax=Roseivirga pacifica TaxID=1267423 RepID=A0A1I0NBW2_9BACT|nr:rhomboid family intramembrane serine protease [Roseivirga pacifica]RKQ51067.1 membrane associated rhomboid family serine protease [Roseivirga pacifica]SEV98553.1 Membrane associated serine protease, rhomboid family [Roseivirga pacifica]
MNNSILDDFKIAFRTGNILNQLIIINVVVFIVFLLLGLVLRVGQQDLLLFNIESLFAFDPRLDELIYKPWSFITYGFTHFNFFHILINLLILYWFGRIITDFLGQNKLLGLYVWGVIAGALLYIVLYNIFPSVEVLGGANPRMIGASAGVYAVVVGAAVFQPNFSMSFILIGPVKIKYVAAVIVILSLSGVTGDNSGGNIAHLGGALVGYLAMSQLQRGNDWSKPVVQFVTWVKSLFKPQPKIKVSYRSERKSSTQKKATSSSRKAKSAPSTSSVTPQEEIDAILDKISERGYDALTKEEKQKLFNASKD